MKIDANDPRWTAYALGEIKDDQERAELEKVLEESPEMRRIVEEIRGTGELLSQHLHAEAAVDLSHVQRTIIEERANAGKSWFGVKPGWVMTAAAAAVVFISIVAVKQLRTPQVAQIKAVVSPNGPPAMPVQMKQTAPVAQVVSPVKAKTFKEFLHKVAENKAAEPATAMESGTEAKPPAEKNPEPPLIDAAASTPSSTPADVPQSTQYAVLGGVVADPTGAVIPGATVKVMDEATGSAVQTTTNSAGQYLFPTLLPGQHTLTATLPGFQPKIAEIALNTGPPTKLDVNLEVGNISQTVTVSTQASNLLTESSSSAGSTVVRPAITSLPLVGSNAMNLVSVMGGVNGSNPQPNGNTVSEVRWPGAPPPPPRPRGFRLPPTYPVPLPGKRFNTEAYDHISDNPFLDVAQNPLSTFSIDVDTASYSNVRRFLESGQLPPKDSVRIEELVNYFDYDYRGPKDDKPFAAHFVFTEAPWNPEHRLLSIGLKGREVIPGKRPNSNLVFLLDVSGSMQEYNKLPLVKEAMCLLLNQLTESDRVAIVIYATESDLWLPSTSGDQKEKIRAAIDRLQANGTTNGAAGIQLAYRTAQENFIRGGTNRVILATDGDFNVGITNRGDLTRMIEEKAKSGIFLSALGFGMGNLKDATLEMLSKNGHGNYAYIDTLSEAKKVLVDQINATLVPIAKDVKIQVEFNPRLVGSYRLIGYEDKVMAKEDFNNDAKDAGVIGAGHTVTALYELVPAGIPLPGSSVDPLKYQKPALPSSSADNNEWLTLKIRSKEPEKDRSVLTEFVLKQAPGKFNDASRDFKFASAVAAFGMILRNSQYQGNANLDRVLEWAAEGKGEDRSGYRQEFIRLVHRTMSLAF